MVAPIDSGSRYRQSRIRDQIVIVQVACLFQAVKKIVVLLLPWIACGLGLPAFGIQDLELFDKTGNPRTGGSTLLLTSEQFRLLCGLRFALVES